MFERKKLPSANILASQEKNTWCNSSRTRAHKSWQRFQGQQNEKLPVGNKIPVRQLCLG